MGIQAVRENIFLRPFRDFGVRGLHFGALRESVWLFEKAATQCPPHRKNYRTLSAPLKKTSDLVRNSAKNYQTFQIFIRQCLEV